MTGVAPDVATADSSPDGPGGAGVPVAAPSAWWVLISGVIGLVASLALTVEKIRMLGDASYVPSCYINPVLSCGSVMGTAQANLFDVPNTLIGIAAFAVVVVSGVLALAKVPLPQWYWVGLTIGAGFGAAFVHWLIFQSLYRIGALCPYCMVVWGVTITLLVVLASIVYRAVGSGNAVLGLLYRWRWSITAVWFATVILLILVRFGDFWMTLV